MKDKPTPKFKVGEEVIIIKDSDADSCDNEYDICIGKTAKITSICNEKRVYLDINVMNQKIIYNPGVEETHWSVDDLELVEPKLGKNIFQEYLNETKD